MLATLTAALCLFHAVSAVPQAASSVGGTPTAPPVQSVPTLTVSTAVASPTVPLDSVLPPQVPVPPVQPWCPSRIFCAGSLLQTVNIARPYPDPKTIVDKPTNKPSKQVLADFSAIANGSAITEGEIVNFLDTDFRGEGLELEAFVLTNFNAEPAFLNNVSDPLLKAWTQIVHTYWTQLARTVNQSALCPSGTENGPCESSFIPLNHTFVVPGGRFREQYYWDTYWIIQGLIESELLDVVNSSLQNFMDELERFGFIPNGGRIYYLNRSQPPLFIHMLFDYVHASNDTSILQRALPLAEKELSFWAKNRTLPVTSPFTNKTYNMVRYAVNNSAPRPESYLEDYTTANDPTLATPLTLDQRSELYSELASGAETGWDFSSRFAADPHAGGTNNTNPILRTLNVKNNVPVDLNSILYNAHILLAELYDSQGSQSAAAGHRQNASDIRAGVLDLFWDPTKLAFYDFNLTSNARNSEYTMANFYPLWNGIVPDELLSSSQNAFEFFASVNMVLNRYNGTFPPTFLETGLQWDAPNAWPPHQHIILQALRALPSNVTANAIPTPPSGKSSFDLLPPGQLGLSAEELPGQLIIGDKNATKTGPGADVNKLNGTVVNGGNAIAGEGWAHALQRELANRYIASAFCSWHATGGSIPNLLPRLPDAALNVTASINNTGNMFEKFSISDIDSAGRGGEYTVQVGFGWTNGVVLWIAGNLGELLVAPQCPDPLAIAKTQAPGGPASDPKKGGALAMLPSGMVVAFAGVLAVITSLLA